MKKKAGDAEAGDGESVDEAYVSVRDLSFRYPAAGKAAPPVFDGFNLTVRQGEIVAVTGASGRGKTTLLRLIAGLERPSRGTIELDGVRLSAPNAVVPPERRGVGMVFQDYALFPHLTVYDNIGFGLFRWSKDRRHGRIREMIRLVRLDGLEGRYPHELSGGQQQRVALARTLAPAPKLVLLDEPFSNLDPDLKAELIADVRALLRAVQTTALIVTHDREDALTVADRMVEL
ncbi:MAG: ABC transporter ATP-binding protein [Hydrogenibacillus sp.]|nr:ABC transporter ATP-binding protein [Hydrogenibacillus sp.]